MPPQEKMAAYSENYVILPPTTTGDTAQPSNSVLRDVRRVLALLQDERILAANELYQNVTCRLNEWNEAHHEQQEQEKSPSKRHALKHAFGRLGHSKKTVDTTTSSQEITEDQEYRAANDLLQSRRIDIDKMIQRAGVIERARTKLDQDEGWTLSQKLFGVTTYYRREEDNSLSLKLDGVLEDVPIFEQVAVLREVDLHYKWSPFCTSSMTLADIDKLDTVGWAVVGLPQYGLARDGCFRAFGCDSIMENGNFYLVGQGLQDRSPDIPYDEEFFLQDLDGIQIPDAPTRLGSGRMTIRGFSAVVNVLSPTKVQTRVVANVNPNLALIPQSLLDFVMRKMCGVVLSKLQHAAKKAASDPIRNAHAQRMRDKQEFYKEWLMPKFESYCNNVGWEMPQVAAFSLTDEELKQAAQSNRDRSASAPAVQEIRSLSSMESAPSMNGNGIHPSTSAPDLENLQNTDDTRIESSDSRSAVSSMSGTSIKSFFRDNRISQYLRELEERTQQEKAKKIAEGRRNMAEQLRPRSISGDNYERLLQLKQAKARRLRRNRGTASVQRSAVLQSSDTAVIAETFDEETLTLADRLYTHRRTTRFSITFLLCFVLMLTLYSDRLLGFESMLTLHADSIWMNILLDIGTFAYLGVSAAVFFVTSYVSLVYAFDSLNIGTKSGLRSKEFYGETISYIVAGVSGIVVALSIGKAIVSVWLRVGLWYTLSASRGVKQVCQNVTIGHQLDVGRLMDHIPITIQSATGTIFSSVSMVVGSIVGAIQSIFSFIWHWFLVIFVHSNIVGRSVAVLCLKVARLFSYMSTSWEAYVSRVIEMYTDNDVTLASWRGIAINTARPFLAYAAVFLLSILILFHATTRTETKAKEPAKETLTEANVMVPIKENGDHPPSSVNPDASPDVGSATTESTTAPPPSRRLRSQEVSSITVQEDIPEEGDDLSLAMTQSFATDVVVGSTDTARKRKNKLRLRLRKKKKNNRDDADSVQSSVTGTSRMKRMETC